MITIDSNKVAEFLKGSDYKFTQEQLESFCETLSEVIEYQLEEEIIFELADELLDQED